MNNSVFGKSIQNQRKHVNIKMALNEKQCNKWIKKPNFETYNILSEDKALIKMRKTTVQLNKPIYVGFTVLELSKELMYDFHYNLFKKYYEDDITLAYYDTDSFLYEIKSENYYEELKEKFGSIMDFSNFNKNSELFDETNKKKLGFLKEEYGGEVINEFIGLKSKLYSINYGEEKTKSKAKGLQKSILKRFVDHKHYKDVIEKNNLFCTNMLRIQSKEHILQTIKLQKLIFTPLDDKRFILEDGINTRPYGHYSNQPQ